MSFTKTTVSLALKIRHRLSYLQNKTEMEECQRSSAKLFMLFQNMLHHLRLRSLQLAPPALGKVQVKVVRQSSPLVRAEPNSQADILASLDSPTNSQLP